MDSVFRIVSNGGTKETYVLDEWGESSKESIDKWIKDLTVDGVEQTKTDATTSQPVIT